MAAVNLNDLDDLEEGPFETSARVNVMMNLLAAHPEDKILRYIIVPVFLYYHNSKYLSRCSVCL